KGCAPTCERSARISFWIAYVDQWDWEQAITSNERTLEYLKATVRVIWRVLVGAEKHVQKLFPRLHDSRYPDLPEELTFLHAEEILEMYPRKQRETEMVQKHSAIFIIAIGWTLKDGYPTRCARPIMTIG